MKRTRLLAALSALRVAQDGVSAVEFALVSAALVVPLVLGGYDIGSALYRWMEVGNAARAGAAYATYCGCFNETNIVAAVGNATTLASIVPNSSQGTPSPAPTQFCGCPSATSGVTATANTPPACGSTQCSSGGFDGTYVTVNAQAQYTPVFSYPGIVPTSGHFTLGSQTTVRIN
jgi:Flp pilus assembly protein TadG